MLQPLALALAAKIVSMRAFNAAIIEEAIEPLQDAVITPDCPSRLVYQLQATANCPVLPLGQSLLDFGDDLALLVDFPDEVFHE